MMKYDKWLEAPTLPQQMFKELETEVKPTTFKTLDVFRPKLEWNITGEVGSRTVFQQNQAPRPVAPKLNFGPNDED